MTVSSFQFKKMETIRNNITLLLVNAADKGEEIDFNSLADIICEEIPIEVIATATGSSDEKLKYGPIGLLSFILISSDMNLNDFYLLCEISGSKKNIFNQIVCEIDKAQSIIGKNINTNATKAIKDIVTENLDRLDGLTGPKWTTFAKEIFEIKLSATNDVIATLKSMNIIEIAACHEFLGEYGYPIFESVNKEDRYFPYKFFRECDHDQMKPLYDLMAVLNGEVNSQREIDKITDRFDFLPAKYIEKLTNGDNLGFIEKAIKSKSSVYERPVKLLVSALRREGRLEEIDSMKKSLSGALIKKEIMTISDLDHMPNAANHHKRQRLASDLQM